MEAKRAEKERVRDDLAKGLLEKVLSSDNMARAWKQVRANKGAPGIDGMSVGDFPDLIRPHWETIRSKLREGTYKPSPVRRVFISTETKSNVMPLAEASFLGFHIIRKKFRWTDKSERKFKNQVRALTKRTRGVSPRKVIADLQSYLRGALNYYAVGIQYREIVALDSWLRRRLRLYYWKQWGRPGTRRRRLISLGIDREEVHRASRSRKGHWRMSTNSLVHRALTDAWLHEQGLPNLTEHWVAIRYPEGPKGSRRKA
jgi:hypothetical protein